MFLSNPIDSSFDGKGKMPKARQNNLAALCFIKKKKFLEGKTIKKTFLSVFLEIEVL